MTTVALVGAAHIHTPGFVKRLQARNDVTREIHLGSPTGASSESIRRRCRRPLCRMWPKIWADPAIEGVIICSETDRHEPLVLAAARPASTSSWRSRSAWARHDAYRMADAIEKAGVLFQTGYFMRGNPIHLFLREQLAAWRVRQGHALPAHQLPFRFAERAGSIPTGAGWPTLRRPACGGFGDLGTHSLDIMLWLMGHVTRRYGDNQGGDRALRRLRRDGRGPDELRERRVGQPCRRMGGRGASRRPDLERHGGACLHRQWQALFPERPCGRRGRERTVGMRCPKPGPMPSSCSWMPWMARTLRW